MRPTPNDVNRLRGSPPKFHRGSALAMQTNAIYKRTYYPVFAFGNPGAGTCSYALNLQIADFLNTIPIIITVEYEAYEVEKAH